MIITISKQEIFNEVEKLSSYEGFVIPERFDNLWANETRGEVLNSFWIQSYVMVIQLMKRYLSESTIDYTVNEYEKDEVVTINAEMPDRYNSLLDGAVSTDIKMLIASNILYRWLEINHVETYSKYIEEVNKFSDSLKSYLLYRISPKNTTSSAKTDDVSLLEDESELSSAKTDDVELVQGWDCNCTECTSCKCNS